MKRIILGKPVVVAQSTKEPVLFGGYQDPTIRCSEDGTLYVRFNARRDSWLTFGEEEKNPVFCSKDGGESWSPVKNGQDQWLRAATRLPNGDIFCFREHGVLKRDTLPVLPPLPEKRRLRTAGMGVYTVDELTPALGDRVAKGDLIARAADGLSIDQHASIDGVVTAIDENGIRIKQK